MNCGNIHFTRTRRDFLRQAGAGFGTLALTHLLQMPAAAAAPVLPLPHRAPKARSVIFLFMEGGPSHIDLFDPKPELNRLAGKQIPDSFKRVITAMGEFSSPLLGCHFSSWLYPCCPFFRTYTANRYAYNRCIT